MKLIFITSPKTAKGRFELNKGGILVVLAVLLSLPVGIGMLSYFSISKIADPALNKKIAENWHQETRVQQKSLDRIKQDSDLELQALNVSLAEAHARLIRIEAMGEKLIESAKLERGEFDFSSRPALGGLQENVEGDAFRKPDYDDAMSDLLARLEEREMQLKVIDSLINDQLLEKEVFLAGRPIEKGWMSSFYGQRLDPFTGKLANHKGVDFAGKENSKIIAVASGVVTWSGDRYGYGLMVEVDHGQGFKTRYAHNKKNLVEVGDIVRKGQALALMGSTGRSTGPHTHFEVLRNGRTVNPERYVYRENR